MMKTKNLCRTQSPGMTCLCLCAMAITARAAVLEVPDAYPTVQAAIDAADPNDTIRVAPGTYYVNLDMRGKAVILTSHDPTNPDIVVQTILDGSQPTDPNNGSVITCWSGETGATRITGFTIRGGTGRPETVFPPGFGWEGTGGGGVYCRGASPTITDNVFNGCSTTYAGAAIYCYLESSPVIRNNRFEDNFAHAYGGAVWARFNSLPIIENNRFERNSCEVLGGALYLGNQSHARVVANLFSRNVSTRLNAGAIYYFVQSNPTIAGNVFYANLALITGSAIHGEGSSAAKIVNNTFVANQLTNPSSATATIAVFDASLISNNIVTDSIGGGIQNASDGQATIRNNNLWNNLSGNYVGAQATDLTGVDGNISADPEIGTMLPDPFRIVELYYDSPCRDTGNSADAAVLATDFDGDVRIHDAAVDMGAQEYAVLSVPGEYTTIQGAVDDAASGDRILVDKGLYEEHIDFLGKNLVLRSLNPLDPNCVAATIIDGRRLDRCLTLDKGESKPTTIAGLTIRNGFASQELYGVDGYGGGIYISDDGGANVLYNHIHHNTSYRYGGGIDTRHRTDTLIAHNLIEHNDTSHFLGGGVHVGVHANVVIRDNIIRYNRTDGIGSQGGGIYVFNFSDVHIVNNQILYNESPTGGGIYAWNMIGKIENNIIRGNFASKEGGGMSLNQYHATNELPLSIKNNIIDGNVSAGESGAIHFRRGNPLCSLTHNTMVGNRNASWSAALSLGILSDFEIANNVISDSPDGLGIRVLSNPDSELIAEPNIHHNLIWNNAGGPIGGELVDLPEPAANRLLDPNFIRDGAWVTADPNDPQSNQWLPGDYRIGWLSPCRDGGATTGRATTSDITGAPRPAFSLPDIGAYELQFVDLDASGSFDVLDAVKLAENWSTPGTASPFDFNDDSLVNYIDFAFILQGQPK